NSGQTDELEAREDDDSELVHDRLQMSQNVAYTTFRTSGKRRTGRCAAATSSHRSRHSRRLRMRNAARLSAMLTALVLMAGSAAAAPPADDDPLDEASCDGVRALFKQLIDAENRHDLNAVRPLVWVSPNALFVAKPATPAEGNWAGFWGTEVVLSHL